ncbi:MAG: hypothetical protein IPH04_09735 [Saprospirales bacterium]|nr:hypothetical protein [Saprospirales bacterium]
MKNSLFPVLLIVLFSSKIHGQPCGSPYNTPITVSIGANWVILDDNHGCDPPTQYKFIPAVNGTLEICNINSWNNVYTTCGTNLPLTNTGSCSQGCGSTSLRTINLTGGVTYYLSLCGSSCDPRGRVIGNYFPCDDGEVVYCGEINCSTTVGAGNDFDSGDYSNCYSGSSQFNGNDVIFEFYNPNSTGYLTVNLFANTDLDLFLLDECEDLQFNMDEISAVNCIAAGTSGDGTEFITDTPPVSIPAGTYYIVVDDYNNQNQGAFDLTVTCGNLSCTGSQSIACGETKNSQTNTSSPNNVSAYQASNGAYVAGYTGKEKVYTFTLIQPQEVEIDLFGFSSSLDFGLFLANNCFQYDVIAESDNASGVPEEIIITLTPGTYYIIVDGYHGSNGTFNISLDCCQTTTNTNCSFVLCYPNNPGVNYSSRLKTRTTRLPL